MADSTLIIKDANGTNRSIATDEVASVHTTKHIVTGALTNAELRATAIPISGALTDAQLRATAVPISGALTDAQLRATAVPISGALTDAQLRATAVPVSGPATDAQLRLTPLRVLTGAELPTTSGTYELHAGATNAAITIPGGTSAIRLFGDVKFRFAVGATPANPVLNALGAGGIVQANLLREVRIPAGSTTIVLRSTEDVISGGDPSPAHVDVEFIA